VLLKIANAWREYGILFQPITVWSKAMPYLKNLI